MVLELARECFEPGGKDLHSEGEKGEKEMQPKPEPPSTLQDNFFYKMPISSNGIELSYLFC